MDINTAAIEWLENEGCPPPVLKVEHVRSLPYAEQHQARTDYRRSVEMWMRRYEEAGLAIPRFVTHHALVEDFDLWLTTDDTDDGPTILDGYTRWHPEQPVKVFVDTGWLWPDPSVDALGPSYSQTYANRHQVEAKSESGNGAEGSGGSAGGPVKSGQNDGGNIPALDRRDRRSQVQDAPAGSGGAVVDALTVTFDYRFGSVQLQGHPGHSRQVPERR